MIDGAGHVVTRSQIVATVLAADGDTVRFHREALDPLQDAIGEWLRPAAAQAGAVLVCRTDREGWVRIRAVPIRDLIDPAVVMNRPPEM